MQMDTLENCLIQVVKVLKVYLLLLMIILMQSHLVLTKDTFFPRIKIKNCNIETDGKNLTLKLMGKTFMIDQLMT